MQVGRRRARLQLRVHQQRAELGSDTFERREQDTDACHRRVPPCRLCPSLRYDRHTVLSAPPPGGASHNSVVTRFSKAECRGP